MEDEELEEILGRLDIPIEAKETKETLRDYLEETLLNWERFGPEMQESVTERVWAVVGAEITMEDIGIRRVTIEYPWGKELRYGIMGLPGLWGYEKAKEIYEASK